MAHLGAAGDSFGGVLQHRITGSPFIATTCCAATTNRLLSSGWSNSLRVRNRFLVDARFEDTQRVREGALFPALLLLEVEAHLKQLMERFMGERDAWEAFDLSEFGHIVVLQPDVDDPGDLGICGLICESGELTGC